MTDAVEPQVRAIVEAVASEHAIPGEAVEAMAQGCLLIERLITDHRSHAAGSRGPGASGDPGAARGPAAAVGPAAVSGPVATVGPAAVSGPAAAVGPAAVSGPAGGVPLIAGLCGTQGSGKSTTALIVQTLLERRAGLRVAILSLDDLYLGRAARAELAREVHPLLATRGVPGTHDVALGLRVLRRLTGREPVGSVALPRLDRGESVALPRFDKATDEPWAAADWPVVSCPVDVVLFEGWCLGAVAEPPAALARPVNALEATEDAAGHWRRHVNDALAGPYRELFGLLDLLVLLRAPGFEQVFAWRREQEQKLAARLASQPGGAAGARLMDDAALARFILHYERLTRHILDEMPARADLVITLDDRRRLVGSSTRQG